MKVPKSVVKYCPACKSHQTMAIKQTKQQGKNKTHPLSRGSRRRMRLRGLDRGFGNHGSISRGAMSSWKRYGAKKSKKVNLTLRCAQCKKATFIISNRAKKVEVVAQ